MLRSWFGMHRHECCCAKLFNSQIDNEIAGSYDVLIAHILRKAYSKWHRREYEKNPSGFASEIEYSFS
jgi:hypothetical protein